MIGRMLMRIALVAVGVTMLVGVAPATAATAANDIPSQTEIENAVSALRSGSARIVELKRERPAWFTPAVERRVREQGVAAAPIDAPLPGQVGIRPGSMMVSPFICTMNFIFRSGSTLAIGTAGHCLEAGEPVVLLTIAPGGDNPVLVELGRTLLRRDGGIGRDYGLVEIPRNLHDFVFPTIAAVGGPCGTFTGGDPQPVAHYGHGLVVGTGGTPRVGMGLELTGRQFRGLDLEWDSDSFAWAGLLNSGDSGSPVRVGQLPAVGNLTHGIGVEGLPTPSPIGWGTRITTVNWELLSSPLCPSGVGLLDDTGGDSGGSGKGGRKGKGQPGRG
jgi:hypothetical protein